MKKWPKSALALGLATSLIVPSFASASNLGGTNLDKKEPYNVKERLNLSQKDQFNYNFKQQKEQKATFSEDTLVVKYEKKLSAQDHRANGTYVMKSYPQLGYDVVKLQKGKKLEQVMSAYKKHASVTSVTQSVSIQTHAVKADPKKDEMYHLQLLEIDKALSLAGDNKVTVAVIDTGIDMNHPDLKNKILPPYNVGDPVNPGRPESHSTHVSGIIAAEKDNGTGGHGVNPNATILPINIFDKMSSFDYMLAEGILYAVENGADVINMSVGTSSKMPIVEEALKVAADKGVVLVASAGNDMQQMIYNYPASYDGVITVGATNDQNELAYFSTKGPQIDLVAPGEDVYNSVYAYDKGSTYALMSGTSMSGPIVAATASLLKSKHPDLNTYEVMHILQQTATDLGPKGFDLDFGWGLVNPTNALKYDVSKLPSFEKPSSEEILKSAKEVSVSEKETKQRGFIQKMLQTDYYKMNVEEGQFVQSILSGSKNYDYKLTLQFYPEGSTESTEPIVVNSARQAQTEGYVFKAPSNGTLVVGVSDANENYNGAGGSSYELTLFSATELPVQEGGSAYDPIEVQSLPYNNKLHLISEEVEYSANGKASVTQDRDVFKLSFDEETQVQIDMSAIPGLNTKLSLYYEFEYYMEIPDWVPEWERDYWKWPLKVANRSGVGGSEVLAFTAYPGQEYILEVTGDSSSYVDDYYYYFFGEMLEESNEENLVKGSLVPYELNMVTKEVPADEDQYPFVMDYYMPYPEEWTEEPTEEQVAERKKYLEEQNLVIVSSYYYYDFPAEDIPYIRDMALPYEIGGEAEGYFQTDYDMDFFKVTADETAIYELKVNKGNALNPFIGVYKYDEKLNTLVTVRNPWSYNYYGPGVEQPKDVTAYVSLEEGEEYYIMLINDEFSFEKYTLSSKRLTDVTVHGTNTSEVKATILKGGEQYAGNFVIPNRPNYFYYKNNTNKEQTVGFKVTPKDVPADLKAKLPSDITESLDVLALVAEDTNGNMRIGTDEANKIVMFDYGWGGEPETGSFKAKPGVGYFIMVDNYYMNTTIAEYELEFYTQLEADEDANSVVKNNVPSKPLSLKADGKDKWTATGKLNLGVPYGDKDYYQFNNPKDATVKFELALPDLLDGIITVYDKAGKQVARFDEYYQNDNEVGFATLKKGTYYVKVEDAFARSSMESYVLTVELVK